MVAGWSWLLRAVAGCQIWDRDLQDIEIRFYMTLPKGILVLSNTVFLVTETLFQKSNPPLRIVQVAYRCRVLCVVSVTTQRILVRGKIEILNFLGQNYCF